MTDKTLSEAEQPKRNIAWGPVAAILASILIYYMSQVFVGLLVSLIPIMQGWSEDRLENWLETSIVAQFGTIFLLEAATLWLLWVFLKGRKAKPADLGLVRPQLKDAGLAIAGYVAYFTFLVIVTAIAGQLIPSLNMEQEQELGFDRSTTGLALLPVFASLVLLPAFTEEVLARGFLYTGLRTKLPMLAAGLITSAMFAAAHLQGGTTDELLWIAALDTFTLSMVMVYLREKTGSLWPAIGVHFMKNGLAFTYLFIL